MAALVSRPMPTQTATPKRTAVVGGGWAGLAAAVEATRLGHAVTLFEMAPQLGGRARSIGVSGLDNGQHILIGAYTETLALMRRVGVDTDTAFVRSPLRISYPDGAGLHLGAGSPAAAFVRAVFARSGWPWAARAALLRAAAGWWLGRFECDPAWTVATLTARLPGVVRDELIDPLCVAALNTPATEASASVFLRVLHNALLSGHGSADLLLPQVGLSALLPDPAAQWLAQAGAWVRLGRRVEHLQAEGDAWRLDGELFDRVVLAATPPEASRLTRTLAPAWSACTAALRFEPIVTVYLRGDGARLPEPMLALRPDGDHPAQFVFDHGQLGGAPGLLAFVVSGAAGWVARGSDATLQATLAQAQTALAAHLRAPLQPVQVLIEKRATFRCTPRLERPAPCIAPGLFAAGDHVCGPYPATLEGAVRSGLWAARRL